jgi:hypothetical protein
MSQTSNNSLLITPTSPFNCGLNYGANEFAVIGDEFAITSNDSVPNWFVDIVGGIVNENVQAIYNSLLTHNSNLLASLEQVEIAKNTYQQYINKVITDESAYVSALSTLNSNIAGNDASIRQLLTTYATSEFAATTAAQLLTASLNGGTIDARIGSAESAMSTQYGAMAQRLDQLDTAFYDTNSQVNSTALAVQKLTTYTGLGTFDGLPDVIANSSFYRTLDAYLDGTNYGTVGGTSTLLQDVTTISTYKAASVEAKFEYGSTIHLNGKDYKSGFGLVQTGTVSNDGTTYNSEFWIDASKFKFTNSNKTGQVAPFTIDASGTTPQVTFNGNVVSSNYIPGSSGWKISTDGNVELNSLVVRTGNLEDYSVTKIVKDVRFYTQPIGVSPTVLNTVTISAGSSPMEVTLIWGGRCGYIGNTPDCQIGVQKNCCPWIDFGSVRYPALDLPGWIASDTLNPWETATYSATADAPPGIEGSKLTLIAIGRMK